MDPLIVTTCSILVGFFYYFGKRRLKGGRSLIFKPIEYYSYFEERPETSKYNVLNEEDEAEGRAILLSAVLLNNGNECINLEHMAKPILIRTSQAFDLVGIKIKQDLGVDASLEINNEGHICLGWKSLRPGDRIGIDILAKVRYDFSENRAIFEFYESLRIKSWIKGMGRRVQKEVRDKKKDRDRSIISMLFIALCLFWFFQAFTYKDSFKYFFGDIDATVNSSLLSVKLRKQLNDSTFIEGVLNNSNPSFIELKNTEKTTTASGKEEVENLGTARYSISDFRIVSIETSGTFNQYIILLLISTTVIVLVFTYYLIKTYGKDISEWKYRENRDGLKRYLSNAITKHLN